MKSRENITFAISCAAFLISIITLYFSSIYTRDKLDVFVDTNPYIDIDPDGKNLRIISNITATFINSGNRSVAVTSASLVTTQSTAPNEKSLCNSTGSSFERNYEVEPFVLAPGEAVVKKLNHFEGARSGHPGIESAELVPTDRNIERNILSCLIFSIATPDRFDDGRIVVLSRDYLPKDLQDPNRKTAELYYLNKPLNLVSKSGSIFGSW